MRFSRRESAKQPEGAPDRRGMEGPGPGRGARFRSPGRLLRAVVTGCARLRRMRWSFRVVVIAGIEVRLHVTFLVFVAWVAISQGLLKGHFGDALAGVVVLLTIFACVLLHELGHALAARRYGI